MDGDKDGREDAKLKKGGRAGERKHAEFRAYCLQDIVYILSLMACIHALRQSRG